MIGVPEAEADPKLDGIVLVNAPRNTVYSTSFQSCRRSEIYESRRNTFITLFLCASTGKRLAKALADRYCHRLRGNRALKYEMKTQ